MWLCSGPARRSDRAPCSLSRLHPSSRHRPLRAFAPNRESSEWHLLWQQPREHRQRQAFLGIFTALCVAVVFIFLGKIIFAALGITVADFQVAGGLILLVLAVRELVGIGPQDRGGGDEFGVVPLGMPLIAGPALLAAALLSVGSVGLVFTLASLLVNLAIVAIA